MDPGARLASRDLAEMKNCGTACLRGVVDVNNHLQINFLVSLAGKIE